MEKTEQGKKQRNSSLNSLPCLFCRAPCAVFGAATFTSSPGADREPLDTHFHSKEENNPAFSGRKAGNISIADELHDRPIGFRVTIIAGTIDVYLLL
ncbi:hypothetical protein ACFO25_00150 [Paenactinomyces guangxiensis]|uniref:Uncharacterized protein n=1 Tax=Paenactinomyces guangxiensis TaxID=1490290 RepID=A0A7W1WSP6_9BACL|nr:hypothetical protein [Paenactinomyces guangxiensis]MBA4495268.1 hypothetical protein [Paenactinomyces guangxiensis]MBH8592352.1 hypothetical protein [Paenactinomyces guangxiensis]